MKKLSFVLAAAGLMSLAACNKPTPVENTTENVVENSADALDTAVDNSANVAEAPADNAAGNAM